MPAAGAGREELPSAPRKQREQRTRGGERIDEGQTLAVETRWWGLVPALLCRDPLLWPSALRRWWLLHFGA